MSDDKNIKAEAHRLIDGLPETASWDDLAYEVYVRQAIESGLADVAAGRVGEHEEALARVRARCARVHRAILCDPPQLNATR